MMHRTTLTLALLLAALPILAGAGRGQCSDPPTPAAGFAITQDLAVLATRSDGYQVLMDVRYPSGAAGPCGWPLVVVVHGGGGNRGVVAGLARSLSEQGYLTCAYDVRGQGPSMALNPVSLGHDAVGLRELIDLFETMETVEGLYPALVDFDRIGVTGYSQGGRHAWWGAMHSGLVPPPNPWRTQPFPVVSAVAARAADAGGSGTPTTFGARMLIGLFGANGITYEPGAQALFQSLILAEDFAGLAATAVPGMDPALLLPQTTVPVLAHASYDDKRSNPSAILASWEQLPTTTPKRLLLGTGGHGSPENLRDTAHYEDTRLRWLDHFLKGQPNGVTNGPLIHAAVTPEDAATYQDEASLWDFRFQNALPAAPTTTQRLYLTPAGGLSPVLPPAAGASALVHTVPAGLDIAAYAAWLPNATQLALAIPPSTIPYDTPPFPADVHLQGEVAIELAVATPDPDFQLHAVLFDVDPAGQARFVASGAAARLGSPGPQTVAIGTYVQSYVFRQGHRLRLQLENLVVHRPPTGGPPELQRVPYFQSSTVAVTAGAAVPSFLDLPVLPFPGPRLASFPARQSVAAPVDQLLTVHTDSGDAGAPYALLVSGSGTSPGTPVLGVTIPLNVDAITLAVLADPTAPPLVNAAGNLDAVGSAHPGLQLGGLVLPPGLAGFALDLAVVTVPGGLEVTNPVRVSFVP